MDDTNTHFPGPGGALRTFAEEGGALFAFADVCRSCAIIDQQRLRRTLAADERVTRILRTPGGLQRLLCVTESGLYRLIFRSRSPKAEAFREWIFRVVLPALRRTMQPGGVVYAPGTPETERRADSAWAYEPAPDAYQRALAACQARRGTDTASVWPACLRRDLTAFSRTLDATMRQMRIPARAAFSPLLGFEVPAYPRALVDLLCDLTPQAAGQLAAILNASPGDTTQHLLTFSYPTP